MIVKMTGVLTDVAEQSIVIERDGVAREVMVPGFAVGELQAHRGSEVVLHTLEFLEGSASNSNLAPRVVGFLRAEDRAFFRRFIEVKGIGVRKGLKALSEPIARIANWIEAGETQLLAKLPGIGRRGAEMIVAELKGKTRQFASPAESGVSIRDCTWSRTQRDAIEVMLAWGDSRQDVVRWLERAGQLHPETESAEGWIRACYRVKAGAEG